MSSGEPGNDKRCNFRDARVVSSATHSQTMQKTRTCVRTQQSHTRTYTHTHTHTSRFRLPSIGSRRPVMSRNRATVKRTFPISDHILDPSCRPWRETTHGLPNTASFLRAAQARCTLSVSHCTSRYNLTVIASTCGCKGCSFQQRIEGEAAPTPLENAPFLQLPERQIHIDAESLFSAEQTVQFGSRVEPHQQIQVLRPRSHRPRLLLRHEVVASQASTQQGQTGTYTCTQCA